MIIGQFFPEVTPTLLDLDHVIECLIHALALRDSETEEHTRRTTAMTLELARAAGIPPQELVHICCGAMLHDIGKIGIPDFILRKDSSLTSAEQDIMRMHPVYAYELLSIIPALRPALDIPYCHHEKWDGTGYPRGLQGTQIPFSARLFAIADVWDALLSNRPYRPAWTIEQAWEYILEQSNRHFDPEAVDIFLGVAKLWYENSEGQSPKYPELDQCACIPIPPSADATQAESSGIS